MISKLIKESRKQYLRLIRDIIETGRREEETVNIAKLVV